MRCQSIDRLVQQHVPHAILLALVATIGPMLPCQIATAQPGGDGPPPARVRVAEMDQQKLQNRWDVVGRLRQVRRSVVAAEVSGKIVAVEIEEGDHVTAGETVLAKIDEVWVANDLARTDATLAQAKADIAKAQAQLSNSRSEFDKQQRLLNVNATQAREFEEAKAAYEADLAAVKSAEAAALGADAAHKLAEQEHERLVIKAPFDGVVVAKMIEVGEWADKGTPVAEIVSRGSIDAVINVPERMINNLNVGDVIDVFIQAIDREVAGEVVAIVPLGETASRTFPVKVRMNDQAGKLKAGMSATARVPMSDEIDTITIPRDALMQNGTESFIWVAAKRDGAPMPTALRVAVKVRFGYKDRYAITPAIPNAGPPLAPGMQVVIEGGERIMFPGQPLQIMANPLTKDEKAPRGE